MNETTFHNVCLASNLKMHYAQGDFAPEQCRRPPPHHKTPVKHDICFTIIGLVQNTVQKVYIMKWHLKICHQNDILILTALMKQKMWFDVFWARIKFLRIYVHVHIHVEWPL